jgi:hypothetical protein
MLGLKYKVGKEFKYHPLTEEQVAEVMNAFIGLRDENTDTSFHNAVSALSNVGAEDFEKLKDYDLSTISIVKIRPISTYVEDK